MKTIIVSLFILIFCSCVIEIKPTATCYSNGEIVFCPDGQNPEPIDGKGTITVRWTSDGLTVKLAGGKWIWWDKEKNKWFNQDGSLVGENGTR